MRLKAKIPYQPDAYVMETGAFDHEVGKTVPLTLDDLHIGSAKLVKAEGGELTFELDVHDDVKLEGLFSSVYDGVS